MGGGRARMPRRRRGTLERSECDSGAERGSNAKHKCPTVVMRICSPGTRRAEQREQAS